MASTLIDAESQNETLSPVAVTAVREWRPPAVDLQSTQPRAEPPDPAAFLVRLAAEWAALTGFAWVFAPCDAGHRVTAAFARGDGTVLAAGFPDALAAALVGQRCGGGFDPAGADLAAPSVVRARAEFDTAMLRAADSAWPGTGSWSPVSPEGRATAFAVTADAGGTSFVLSFAVVAATAPVLAPAEDGSAWARSLRRALDATPFAVRAVLHEQSLRLTEAIALRVGDVLPIETRRDVSLRLGDRALARGTITSDDDGGHRVTIVGHARPGVTLPPEEPV